MFTDVLVAPWAEPVAHANHAHPVTLADLAGLSEDGWVYELVMGRLVRMPPPKARHGYLEAEIGAALQAFVKQRSLGRVYVGETGFDLTVPGEVVETVLGADVAFVRIERVPPASDTEDTYIQGAPDLVVEIASSSQFRPEMGAKAWLWLQRGAHLVWVVWPGRRQVDVWLPGRDEPATLQEHQALDGGEVLPGFSLTLADLFGS